MCRTMFAGSGGAIGFSRARAAAVVQWLVAEGNLGPDAAHRLEAVGHGGSRRIVHDTESPENALNRRVEAHIIDFVA